MADTNFWSRFGIFLRKEFLDAETCRNLRNEATSSGHQKAAVCRNDTVLVDESFRSTRNVEVSNLSKRLVYDRLIAVKPEVEKHYRVTLSGCEKPQLLLYRKGDFFQLHRDAPDSKASPGEHHTDDLLKRRQISTVIFLNDQATASSPGAYSGGSLNLFGLVNDPRWARYGFPLVGETGLLVAFRSDLAHEVTQVVSGERHTIVSWFF